MLKLRSLDALLFLFVCGITNYGQNSMSKSRSSDVLVFLLLRGIGLEITDKILFLQCLEFGFELPLCL